MSTFTIRLAPRVMIRGILPRVTLPAPSAVERAENRLGRTIREKYRLERVLGVGGMATVYLATHRNGSRAAVKILHPELAVLDVHRERFVREAYVANSIEHDGAVRVVDDDVAEDNCPFLVMELLEGETLEARRKRLGRLDMRETLVMGHALCDALGAAHDAGVVHRDIKPENIFLTKSGALKVLDFGIARVRHEGGVSGTRTGVMMGTPAFMPPEQALGRRAEIDARTDLWALGATLFTLLSGRFVHEADSPEEMMVRAATQSARSLLEVFPEVPLPIAKFITKALSFRREDRFATAYEMRDALGQVHEDVFGEGIETTLMPSGPASLPITSLRLSRKNQAVGETLPAAEEPRDEAAPTVVERRFHGDDSPTIAEPSGVLPTVDAPVQQTRIEGTPRTQRSGEAIPASRRTRRRRLLMSAAALCAAAIPVFVGIRHVTGDPVEKNPSVACTQNADCAAGEHCDETQGRCAFAQGCSSNAACVAELDGKAAICRKDVGKCVALETEYCRVFSEKADLQNDETVWVGAMYPERDKSMGYGREAMRAVNLARHDFASLTGGLPPLKSGGKSRPLAIVACDDTEHYENSAEHLVNDVGVQAILGFGRSKEVLDLASRYFIPKNILALASNTASMISSIPHEPEQPRMIFRVTTHADVSNSPMAMLVREVVAPQLRASGILDARDELKIALMCSENASGTSHTAALVDALEKTRAGMNSARDDIRPFIFEDRKESQLSAKDERAIDDLIAFAPHVVLDAAASEYVYFPVEQRWPKRSKYRPRYVISHSVASEEIRKLALFEPTAPSRIFSKNLADGSPAVSKFVIHYNGFYHENFAVDDLNGAPYDAFYIFAYAAASLGQMPLTGRNLARAVTRLLPPGETLEVGPSKILQGFNLLAAGRNIDLAGAQTSLDFDLETGNPAIDFEVNCFDRKTQQSIWGGMNYRSRSGHWEGTWKCP